MNRRRQQLLSHPPMLPVDSLPASGYQGQAVLFDRYPHVNSLAAAVDGVRQVLMTRNIVQLATGNTIMLPLLPQNLGSSTWSYEFDLKDPTVGSTGYTEVFAIYDSEDQRILALETTPNGGSNTGFNIVCYNSGEVNNGNSLFSVTAGFHKYRIHKDTVGGQIKLDIDGTTLGTINYITTWVPTEMVFARLLAHATSGMSPLQVANIKQMQNGIVDIIPCDEGAGTTLWNQVNNSRNAFLNNASAWADAAVPDYQGVEYLGRRVMQQNVGSVLTLPKFNSLSDFEIEFQHKDTNTTSTTSSILFVAWGVGYAFRAMQITLVGDNAYQAYVYTTTDLYFYTDYVYTTPNRWHRIKMTVKDHVLIITVDDKYSSSIAFTGDVQPLEHNLVQLGYPSTDDAPAQFAEYKATFNGVLTDWLSFDDLHYPSRNKITPARQIEELDTIDTTFVLANVEVDKSVVPYASTPYLHFENAGASPNDEVVIPSLNAGIVTKMVIKARVRFTLGQFCPVLSNTGDGTGFRAFVNAGDGKLYALIGDGTHYNEGLCSLNAVPAGIWTDIEFRFIGGDVYGIVDGVETPFNYLASAATGVQTDGHLIRMGVRSINPTNLNYGDVMNVSIAYGSTLLSWACNEGSGNIIHCSNPAFDGVLTDVAPNTIWKTDWQPMIPPTYKYGKMGYFDGNTSQIVCEAATFLTADKDYSIEVLMDDVGAAAWETLIINRRATGVAGMIAFMRHGGGADLAIENFGATVSVAAGLYPTTMTRVKLVKIGSMYYWYFNGVLRSSNVGGGMIVGTSDGISISTPYIGSRFTGKLGWVKISTDTDSLIWDMSTISNGKIPDLSGHGYEGTVTDVTLVDQWIPIM